MILSKKVFVGIWMFGTVTLGKIELPWHWRRQSWRCNMAYRIRRLDTNKDVRYFVLICGTNIDKNVPADIVKSIKYCIQLIKCKFYNCKVIVLGILPRDFSPGMRRNKSRLVNIQIKCYIYRPRPYINNMMIKIKTKTPTTLNRMSAASGWNSETSGRTTAISTATQTT